MSHTCVNFSKLSALIVGLVLFAGCTGGGAVVFAPTAPPPDTSPIPYAHPGGAFTVSVPRQWALYEQNTTALASASFSPPGADDPALTLAAIRLDADSAALDLAALLDRYQTQIRPDADRYRETARTALPDGSWRLEGVTALSGGRSSAGLTYIGRRGDQVSVIDIPHVDRLNAAALAALEAMAASADFNPDAALDPAPLSALGFVKAADLALLHVTGWHTPTGVFYLTGEVANYGPTPLTDLTVEAGLFDAAGAGVAGAADVVMGYAVPPGGFAPFSLRFGEGQAARAADYAVRLSGGAPTEAPIGADGLTWTDEAGYDALNRLVISGRVTNTGANAVFAPRALATVFDGEENVIGAAWVEVAERIVPGASVEFAITLGELGGSPENYLIVVQGRAS